MSFDAMREQTLQRFTVRVFRMRIHVLLPVAVTVLAPLLLLGVEPWRAWALGGATVLVAAFFVWDARRIRHTRVDAAFFRGYVPLTGAFQSGLIALTGGLTSPLLPVYLPLMWVAGTGLQRWRDVMLMPSLVALALATMGAAHALGWLTPVPGLWPGSPAPLWMALVGAVLGAVSFATAAFAHRVAQSYEEIDRSLERARNEAVEVHQERLRNVEGLSRRVAHEIRNPLAAIKGLTQLLQRRGDPTGHLAVIASEVERLQQILDGFLSFSRPMDDLRCERCDLATLARDVLTVLEARLEQASVATTLDVAGDTSVSGDPSRLKQVLMNMMLNAIEAMERGSGERRLHVTVEGGARVAVRVDDTGPGLDAVAAERAFEPSVSEKPDGTGLGLPISRAIARAHGGDVRLERTSEGARAVLELPPLAPWREGA